MTRAAALATLLTLACAGSSRSTAPAAVQSASPGKAAEAAAPANSPLICRTERPTGSNYPRRVCYREEDIEATRAAAQDAHRRAISGGTQPRHD